MWLTFIKKAFNCLNNKRNSCYLFAEDIKQPGHCGSLPDGPYVLKGRDDTCEQIVTSLMSNKAVEIVAPPGYGKTSVVVEAAHRLIVKAGSFVAYVNPRGVSCVEDLGSRIIEALGEVPGDHWDQNFGIPYFCIFENSLWLLVTMPNFNSLR